MASPVADQAQALAPAPAPAQPSPSQGAVATPPAPEKSTTTKPIHSLVLDTGPLIKNEVSVSTLISQAEVLYTIPAVIDEIRDEATRSRIHTTLLPFLTLRSPSPKSIKFVSDFARKTGDLQVLSKPDLHLIALTYELECERNGGDWRLRKDPGQKRVNGPPPSKAEEADKTDDVEKTAEEGAPETSAATESTSAPETDKEAESATDAQQEEEKTGSEEQGALEAKIDNLNIQDATPAPETVPTAEDVPEVVEEVEEDSDSDGEGWITPSNLKQHQAKNNDVSANAQPVAQRTLQAALLTSDYAMQNVSLRINLNLIGPSLSRITHVRTWVLRCHGCFTICKQTDKQFCPSCGQATLTRTACSTDKDGNFRVHLKRNFQYNKRGNVYSIPKAVHGSANGKLQSVQGGGRNGWGRELILAEDQKEYTRRLEDDKRTKYRDAMDDDYLPDLLTGRRNGGGGGKPKVGAGRNVNSKRRR